MNRNKKSLILVLVLFFFLTKESSSQNSFTYSNGSFNLNLAPINPNNPPPDAYYRVFIETGDGRYIKPSQQIQNAPVIPTQIYPYDFHLNNGSKALVTLAAYYDTTPRPPRNTSIAVSNPTTAYPLPQVYIPVYPPKQTRLVIDPCTDVIVPGDTMAFAITYKPYVQAGTYNVVAFFYNMPGSGGNIFGTINDQTMFSFNSAEQIKAIRMHNGETVSDILPNNLPLTVKTKLNMAGEGYSNALYFIIPAGADESEKNIFLSLAPSMNGTSYDDAKTTSVSATIIQYGSAFMKQQIFPLSLGINLVARDPNGIHTTPNCFNGSEGIIDPHNILITNSIDFQNEGMGRAKDVIVTVTVPDGIQIPTLLSSPYLYRNGSARLFKPWSLGEKYYYHITGRKIIFTMRDIRLPGNRERNAEKRSGEIKFSLRTNREGVVPDCMYTYVSIVFVNDNPKHTANKEVTGHDLVSTDCNNTKNCHRFTKADPKVPK